MGRLVIEGGTKLVGEVSVAGAKNAALPLLAATLLTKEESTLLRTPMVDDIHAMVGLLRFVGAAVKQEQGTLTIAPDLSQTCLVSSEASRSLRASICLMGPILARHGKIEIQLPGGCNLGPRPIDLHVQGLTALGAEVEIVEGSLKAWTRSKLQGNCIDLSGPYGSSVLATANTLMAATLAVGETIIHGAAREPEIVDLVCFLKKMGASIQGEGTARIIINGVRQLHGADHEVISDRIEAGTIMMATVATGGDVRISGIDSNHTRAVLDALESVGAAVLKMDGSNLRIRHSGTIRPVSVTARPYPGFPTDLQAQWTALMAKASGTSTIRDEVFPARFRHIEMMNRLGAKVLRRDPQAIVIGVDTLYGAKLQGCDLRASAALIIAALTAEGCTELSELSHLDRGYEGFENKLACLGAAIVREPDSKRIATK